MSTVERLETERGIISNGAFITFKILLKISVRSGEKIVSGMELLEITGEFDSHFKADTVPQCPGR